MKLYEWAVILNEKTDQDGNVIEEAELVVGPSHVLARDDAQAQMLAARSFPKEYLPKIDRLTVVVRPF